MSREKYEAQSEAEELKKSEAKLNELNQILEFSKSLLDLKKDATFSRFLKIFVFDPLNDLQTKSDNMLETNFSFRLKGEIRAFKRILKWEATQKETCDRLRKERDSIVNRLAGEKPEHEPE